MSSIWLAVRISLIPVSLPGTELYDRGHSGSRTNEPWSSSSSSSAVALGSGRRSSNACLTPLINGSAVWLLLTVVKELWAVSEVVTTSWLVPQCISVTVQVLLSVVHQQDFSYIYIQKWQQGYTGLLQLLDNIISFSSLTLWCTQAEPWTSKKQRRSTASRVRPVRGTWLGWEWTVSSAQSTDTVDRVSPVLRSTASGFHTATTQVCCPWRKTWPGGWTAPWVRRSSSQTPFFSLR